MRKVVLHKGRVVLYCCDCAKILPRIKDVGCVITDPPYGIASKWQGGFSSKHGWGGKALREVEERNTWDVKPPNKEVLQGVICKAKTCIIWGGNYFELPPSRCWFVWVKPERGFSLADCELAWTNIDNVARVYNCHRYDANKVHPTQKPLKLMEWCVKKTKGKVFDPYMGVGTTGVAAVKLGRKFVGIEINPKYFDLAVGRIRNTEWAILRKRVQSNMKEIWEGLK